MRLCVLLSLLAACTRYQGLPCSSFQGCENGFTCRMTECVEHHSVAEGESCTEDLQCALGLVCPQAFFVCSKPCSLIYDLDSECAADEVCAPVFDPARTTKYLGGACVAPECSNDADCDGRGGALTPPFVGVACVPLARNGGGLCLQTCTIGKRRADVAAGADLCVADLRGAPTHCGRIPAGGPVCLPTGNAKEGELCQLFPAGVDAIDACSMNIDANNIAGPPLVCTAPDGSGNTSNTIDLRCHAE